VQGHLRALHNTADKRAYLNRLEQTERNKVLIELAKSYMRAGIMARSSGPLGQAIQSFKDAKGEDSDG
jgi:lipopolysaccharide biosynthesis regulator YciM